MSPNMSLDRKLKCSKEWVNICYLFPFSVFLRAAVIPREFFGFKHLAPHWTGTCRQDKFDEWDKREETNAKQRFWLWEVVVKEEGHVGEVCKEYLEGIWGRVSVSNRFENYLYDIPPLRLTPFLMNFILMSIINAYI